MCAGAAAQHGGVRERLIRALQKGGCASRTAEGGYQVWRRRDLRGRSVGQLSGSDIAALRVKGALSVLSLDNRRVLIWSGPAYTPTEASGSPSVLLSDTTGPIERQVSLLQRVFDHFEGEAEQSRIARAAYDFRADFDLSNRGDSIGGMNWRALSAGTRIDGGRQVALSGQKYSARAGYRMNLLQDRLGIAAYRLLMVMIVDEVTRNAAGRRLHMKPETAEARAKTAIVALADAYDHAVRRPDRSTLSA